MYTLKALRASARSYGLPGTSKLKKNDLIKAIAEVRAVEWIKRLKRAQRKPGKFPALLGDVENPHKQAQRGRELRRIDNEVDAALRAIVYTKRVAKNPLLRSKPLKQISRRLTRPHEFGKPPESLARQIVQEGGRILEEVGEVEGVERGRRTILLKFYRHLEEGLTDRIMEKLEQELRTSFYLQYSYTYRIRNVENGKVILYHTNFPENPWINALSEARNWIQHQEATRLNVDRVDRPNTKWAFVRHIGVNLKAVLDQQPLMGTGPLPDWLRWKK